MLLNLAFLEYNILAMENPLIVITGPTASGKTALSLELAEEFDAEVISADSMTVYKDMAIGTDSPVRRSGAKKENGAWMIEGVKHHLLDLFQPDEEFNVAVFRKLATEKVKEVQKAEKIPFLVGGTVLYIDALVYDYQLPDVEPDLALRSKLEKKSEEELFEWLLELDPDAEWTIDRKNKRRLIRAIEVSLSSAEPFSKQGGKRTLPSNVLYLALEMEREELYGRINERVDQMMVEGFLDEVKKLHQAYDHNSAMQAAGYRQLIQYLEGEITLEEAVEKTKQVHRNYAKRQLTWLRKNPDVIWVKNLGDSRKIIANFIQK